MGAAHGEQDNHIAATSEPVRHSDDRVSEPEPTGVQGLAYAQAAFVQVKTSGSELNVADSVAPQWMVGIDRTRFQYEQASHTGIEGNRFAAVHYDMYNDDAKRHYLNMESECLRHLRIKGPSILVYEFSCDTFAANRSYIRNDMILVAASSILGMSLSDFVRSVYSQFPVRMAGGDWPEAHNGGRDNNRRAVAALFQKSVEVLQDWWHKNYPPNHPEIPEKIKVYSL